MRLCAPLSVRHLVAGKFTRNAELAGLSEHNRDRILEAFLETANPNIDILNDLASP
jgi:hypothetical protein